MLIYLIKTYSINSNTCKKLLQFKIVNKILQFIIIVFYAY